MSNEPHAKLTKSAYHITVHLQLSDIESIVNKLRNCDWSWGFAVKIVFSTCYMFDATVTDLFLY